MCFTRLRIDGIFTRDGLYLLCAMIFYIGQRQNKANTAPNMNHTEIDRLLESVAQGDENAFSKFYDLTAPMVYGLATRIVRDAMLAEDVVSDCYFQVWQQAANYSPERGHGLNWCLLIARSRALDALRKRREMPATDQQMHALAEMETEDTLDVAEQVEEATAVRAALDRLSEKQRKLVSLAFFGDLSHGEISRRTGIPLGSVKSGLRESMVVLRRVLKSPGGTGKGLS